MKNYIANGGFGRINLLAILRLTSRSENGSWDTSKALVRRTLERCIQIGRQGRATNNKLDVYESYRLLGQAVSACHVM